MSVSRGLTNLATSLRAALPLLVWGLTALAAAGDTAPKALVPRVPATWQADRAKAGCTDCGGSPVDVAGDVTIDLNVQPAAVIGDQALVPYLTVDTSAADPSQWTVLLDLGNRALTVRSGATVTVAQVATATAGRFAAPGLELRTTCDITVEAGGAVTLGGTDAATGDLRLLASGDLTLAGRVANQITGTWGRTGELVLASQCGSLTVTETGRVQLEGSQEGGKDLFLYTQEAGADLVVRGLVDAHVAGGRPAAVYAHAGGALLVDGSRLVGREANTGRIVGAGISARGGGTPSRVELSADGNLDVHGFGDRPWIDAGSYSTTFALNHRGGTEVPVTATYTQTGADTVNLQLTLAPGSGTLRAVFGNLADEQLTLSASGDITDKTAFATNGVDGIPNAWMAPPGGWDFGLGLAGDGLSATVTLTAPGLTIDTLMAAQSHGYGLGVLVALPAAGKNGDLVPICLLNPVYAGAVQYGTVAARTKLGAGGVVVAASLGGTLTAELHALDVRAVSGDNGAAEIYLDAHDDLVLTANRPAAVMQAGGPGQGGTNRLIARHGGITVGAGAVVHAVGSPEGRNLLTACTGVSVAGSVLPADTEPGDDSGTCGDGPGLGLSVDTPLEGAFQRGYQVAFQISVTEPRAEVFFEGQSLGRDQAAYQLNRAFADGIHDVTVEARLAGRVERVVRRFIIDNQGPSAAISGPNQIQRGAVLNFSWTLTDALTTPVSAEVTIDGVQVAGDPEGSYAYQVPPDAGVTSVVIRVRGTDAAGNTGYWATKTVQVSGGTVLAVQIDEPAPDTLTREAQITVRGTVTEGATVSVNGTNAAVTGGTWAAVVPLSGEGGIDLTAAAELSGLTVTDSVRVVHDTLPPQLSLEVPNQASPGDTITLTWEVTDASPTTVRLHQDGLELSTQAAGSTTFTVPGDTTASELGFTLEATDAAGNEASVVLPVSLTPADIVLTLDTPAEGAVSTTADVLLSGTVDPVDAVVTLAGEAVTRNGAAWSHTLTLDDGTHTLTASAAYPGRTSAGVQRTITVDTLGPTLTVTVPERLVRGSTYLLTALAEDPAGVIDVAWLVDDDLRLQLNGAAADLPLDVPVDAPEAAYRLRVVAHDALGHEGVWEQTVPLVGADELDEVMVTVTSHAHNDTLGVVDQVLTGSVNPPDAALSLNGTAVAVEAGQFAHPVALAGGINTLLLRGEKEGYLPGTAKLDLYLDNIDPVITILQPENGAYTHESPVLVSGQVSDQYDTAPTLTRDGTPVTVTQGRFVDPDLALTPGENTFTYTAVDQLGNSSTETLTVFFDDAGPDLSLDHPAMIVPGASYTVTVGAVPAAEVVDLRLTVAGEEVYAAESGAEEALSLTHDGEAASVRLHAVAVDLFGNVRSRDGEIAVARPHYVHGQVLTDEDGLPLENMAVTVHTPAQSLELTTDAQGAYSCYLYGDPVTVSVSDPAYVAMVRRRTGGEANLRISDLRLTPRKAPGAEAVEDVVVLAGGLAGARVTPYGPQALPELPPLGYSPVAGIELAGVAADAVGTLDWQRGNLTPFPAGTSLVLLHHEAAGWRVLDLPAAGDTVRVQRGEAAPGAYLVVVPDGWAAGALPAIGDLLVRDRDDVVLPNSAADAATDPARVSLMAEPRTRVSVTLENGGHYASGSRMQVWGDERHERYEGTLAVPRYPFDLFVYAYGHGSLADGDRLGGDLGVHAREPVAVAQTKRAEILFSAVSGTRDEGSFQTDADLVVGAVHVDMRHTADGPRLVHLEAADTATDVGPLGTVAAAFEMTVGGSLDRAPLLSYESDAWTHMLLLRREADGRLFVAGALTRDDGVWHSGVDAAMTESGTYLLVGFAYAVIPVEDTVTHQGAGRSGAVVTTAVHPWSARCAADGTYRTWVPAIPREIVLRAFHDGLRLLGTHVLPAGDGVAGFSGRDIALAPRGFRLTAHEPADGEPAVDTLPRMLLAFDIPVTDDAAKLAAGIRLTDGVGDSVPLQFLTDEGGLSLRVLPGRALTPGTTYTLTLLESLPSAAGDTLGEATAFSFTTRVAEAVGDLDLQRFYLSLEGEDLFLVGPEGSFPAGTVLDIEVDSTSFRLTRNLGTAAYRERLDAVPGDVVALRATPPGGGVFLHSLDLVKTGPDTLRFGARPFKIELEPGFVLHVDQVTTGAGVEVEYRLVTPAEMAAEMQKAPTFAEAGAFTVLRSVAFRALGQAPLPQFSGSLEVTPPPGLENGLVQSITLLPDVQAPIDPTAPDVMGSHTLAKINDAQPFQDGAVVAKNNRKSLLSALVLGVVAAPAIGYVYFAVTAQHDFALNSASFANQSIARAMRKNTPYLAAPPVKEHAWHGIAEQADAHPVPGAYFYSVIWQNNAPRYFLQAITGPDGQGEFWTQGHILYSLRALDPATGQLVYVEMDPPQIVEDERTSFLFISSIYSSRAVYGSFNPEEHLINNGQPPPPTLSISLEAGTFDLQGNFLPDAAATADLQRLNKIVENAGFGLRVTVTSSQSLGTSPPPHLSVTSGVVPPAKPENDKQVSWTFPAGIFGAETLLDIRAEVANSGGTTGEAKAYVLVVGSGKPGVKEGRNPLIVLASPADGAKKVNINEEVYLAFSEPVRGISATTVRLTGPEGAIPLTFLDEEGFEVTTPQQVVTELYAVPQRTFGFDGRYTLTVKDLTDLDTTPRKLTTDPVKDPTGQTPYTYTFTTAPLEVVDQVAQEYRDPIAAHLNLVLQLNHEVGGRGFDLSLYDVRKPYEKWKPVWRSHIDTRKSVEYHMQLFVPEDLDDNGGDYSETVLREAGDIPLDNLPEGTLMTLNYRSYWEPVNYLDIYQFDGSTFTKVLSYIPLEAGWANATTKVGRYLDVGYFQALGQGETTLRGSRVTYDIVALLRDLPGLQGRLQRREINRIEYETSLQSLGIAARYPVPGDHSDLQAFFRKDANDTYRPAVADASLLRPVIWTFDLTNHPTAMGIPVPSGDPATESDGVTPKYDGRMLVRTDYHNGSSFGGKGAGGVEQLRFRDPDTGLITSADFAVFSHEKGGNSSLYVYQLPEDMVPLDLDLAPRVRLDFPGVRLKTIAVDRKLGLVAVADRNGVNGVLDLKVLLETTRGIDASGYQHGAFITVGIQGLVSWMMFHEGTLYTSDFDSNVGLKRLPIAPKTYRTVGWEYLDLQAWMKPGTTATEQFRYAPYITFHATDLLVPAENDADRGFMMELGTFGFEMLEKGDLEVGFYDKHTDTLLGTVQKRKVLYPSMQSFAAEPVRTFFEKGQARLDLRKEGYKAFYVRVQLKEGDQVVLEKKYDFLVAYQYPATRYVDPYRNIGDLDAVSLMPTLFETDYAASNADPRLDYSGNRLYHADYAFESGAFGAGMVSGQMLHMAYPIWWDLDKTKSEDGFGAEAAVPRLILEHPGQFRVECVVDEGVPSVMDDLNSELSRTTQVGGSGSGWVFNHHQTMYYQFASDRPLTDYPRRFDAWNASVRPEARHYPVFRAGSVQSGPANFLTEVLLKDQRAAPWTNRKTFENSSGDASALPTVMAEHVNDLGGTRKSALTYQGGAGRAVVQSQSFNGGGLVLTYRYDQDGYLQAVSQNGGRTLYYAWDPVAVSVRMGRYRLKRLTSITQTGIPEGDIVTTFHYTGPDSLKVSSIDTMYGSKPVAVVYNADNLVGRVDVAGAGAPDRVSFFKELEHQHLSHTRRLGNTAFLHQWVTQTNGQKRQWLISEDTYLDQKWFYDAYGRLEEHQQLNGQEKWYYSATVDAFMAYPITYIDPIGSIFTIKTDLKGMVTTNGNASTTQTFSSSGAVVGGIGLDTLQSGAGDSRFYAPDDAARYYRASQGRPVQVPFDGYPSGGKPLPQYVYKYNPFGEPVTITDMGRVTQFQNHDGLGRPRHIVSFGGASVEDWAYDYGNGLLSARVTTTLQAGLTGGTVIEETYTDELGRIRRTVLNEGTGRVRTVDITYDDLDRPIQMMENGNLLTGITYSGDTTAPAVVTTAEETWTHSYSALSAFYPERIGSDVQDNLGTLSRHIPHQTDRLGRTVKGELDGIGVVTYTYDAWSRPTKVVTDPGSGLLGAGRTLFDYAYQGNTTAFIDHRFHYNAVRTRHDPSGFSETLQEFGINTPKTATATKRSLTNQISLGGPLVTLPMYVAIEESADVLGLLKQTHVTAADGTYLGGAVSPLSYGASAVDALGKPTFYGNQAGTSSTAVLHDTRGRMVQGSSIHGEPFSKNWDVNNRLDSAVNVRGQDVAIGYRTPTGDAVDATRVDGVPVYQNTGTDKASSTAAWGDAREEEATGPAAVTLTARRTTQAPDGTSQTAAYTAEVEADEASGRLTRLTEFLGRESVLTHDAFGRIAGRVTFEDLAYEVTWSESEACASFDPVDPGEEAFNVCFDAYGRVYSYNRGGTFFRFERDRLGRIIHVETNEGATDLTYNGALLTDINGKRDISFSQHNAMGMPEITSVGGIGTIEQEWHPGGRPKLTVFVQGGQELSRVGHDKAGRLSSVRRGGDLTEYHVDGWGAVDKIRHNGTEYLFDQTNLSWQLPGGTELQYYPTGSLKTYKTGGRTYDYAYDAMERLTEQRLNGNLLYTYTYEGRDVYVTDKGGKRLRLRFNADGNPLSFDSIVSVGSKAEEVESLGRFTYDTAQPERVVSYTDPNAVRADYGYDGNGNLSKIDIENGPSFHYTYDAQGNLAQTTVDGMSAAYEAYDGEWPGVVTWGNGRVLTTTRDDQGHLASLGTADFGMTWTWQEDVPDPMIATIVRRAAGFSEEVVPTYSADRQLAGVRITRGNGDVVEETYQPTADRVPGALVRTLNGVEILHFQKTVTDQQVVSAETLSADGETAPLSLTYDEERSLTAVTADAADDTGYQFERGAGRNLTALSMQRPGDQMRRYVYRYDYADRRVESSDAPTLGSVVYFWHDNRILAVGLKELGRVRWTHALGYGPTGLAFIKDLTGSGRDYYILGDHQGTPFAWENAHTGAVSLTPYSPWGELLATPAAGAPYTHGNLPTQGFALPEDAVFEVPPFGLAGHLYDPHTGLVYMGARAFSPRLGMFLTADFRSPDLTDLTTITEYYAYAHGNPIMFWDPNGLSTARQVFDQWNDSLVALDQKGGVKNRVLAHSGALAVAVGSAVYKVGNFLTLGSADRLSATTDDFANGRIDGDTYLQRAGVQLVTAGGAIALTALSGGASSALMSRLGAGAVSTYAVSGAVSGVVDMAFTDALAIQFDGQEGFSPWQSYAFAAALGGGMGAAVGGIQSRWGAKLQQELPSPVQRKKIPVEDISGCFAAGTLVHTDRGLVPIETLTAGDRVAARDQRDPDGPVIFAAVKDLSIKADHVVRDLTLRDAAGRLETVAVTDAHPYFVLDLGWLEAGALRPGDRVAAAEGFLTVVGERGPPITTTVYNLDVPGPRTFFVGNQAAWVHNDCDIPIGRQILVDNDVLVHALDRPTTKLGEVSLEIIKKNNAYVTPQQLREFVGKKIGRPDQLRRVAFLKQHNITILNNHRQISQLSGFQNLFDFVARGQGAGDAALTAYAHFSGLKAYTANTKLADKFLVHSMGKKYGGVAYPVVNVRRFL